MIRSRFSRLASIGEVIRFSCPNVLAVRNRVEHAFPTLFPVKDRYVQYKHGVMPRASTMKPFPRFPAVSFGQSWYFHFRCFLSAGEEKQGEDANQDPEQWAEQREPEGKSRLGRRLALVHYNVLASLLLGCSPALSTYPPKR